jgi:uncharacterized protein (DUF983 family)
MNATIDVRIDCPWCGQGLLIAEATTALAARCDACSTTVDLADPAPAQQGVVLERRAAVAA